MTFHASFEQAENVTIVGVLCEAQTAAVGHKFEEFAGLVLAKNLKGDFLLLSLDGSIFLILGASWKSLPREGAAQEVEKHVADCL